MIQVSSIQSYHELKHQVAASSSSLGLVVHFAADWCTPCETVRTVLNQFDAEYNPNTNNTDDDHNNNNNRQLTFAEVNCEVHDAICEAEAITSVPFIAFFRPSVEETGDPNAKSSKKTLERIADVAGAKIDSITRNIRSLYGPQRADFPSLDAYLRALINRPGVVAFITGTPSRPQCGFTSRLCALFEELDVDYLFHDIMASGEVCEGLKHFSRWPTFPQVYVNSSLIGGYDVCKQLQEEGELRSTLIPE
ncbi:unnamed protein product [Phytomonas sp. Hart1]|nr:unnamed protein product [Phytomonas sp. Hart1]|eukprot:CCW71942.1 unnamed protein product [Phytomonas sp. isolate Hart1]